MKRPIRPIHKCALALGLDSHSAGREYYVVVCCAPYHLHRIKFAQKNCANQSTIYSLAQVLVPLLLSHTKTFLA
jgi:hypothetical protein